MATFMDALLKRRSIYGIDGTIPCSDEDLQELLGTIIQNTPTAFNMQSSRAMLLLGTQHARFWGIVQDVLETVTPEEKFPKTKEKLAGFAAGHGTILYFDDTAITNQFAEEYTTYKDLFPDWALQQNGMLQFAVWAALAERGIGASLQHYNPLIDGAIAAEFNLPGTWRLLAQMPFGSITQPPDDKDMLPLEQRLRILK